MALLVGLALSAAAQGIPEPGLVLYGTIRNLDGVAPVRMTTGPLSCRITPPTGSPITLATNLQDINGQFSYVLTIPFETDIGTSLTPNTLAMPGTTASYALDFTLASTPTRTVTTRTVTFSRADRARQQRVDADFSMAYPDANGNGLPDWWKALFFNGSGSPNADNDGDGLNNLAEYLAGTNPTSRLSTFAFVNVHQESDGIVVEWSSVANRIYTLERSTNLLTGFTAFQTNLVATPPKNTVQDRTTTSQRGFFYRVRLE